MSAFLSNYPPAFFIWVCVAADLLCLFTSLQTTIWVNNTLHSVWKKGRKHFRWSIVLLNTFEFAQAQTFITHETIFYDRHLVLNLQASAKGYSKHFHIFSFPSCRDYCCVLKHFHKIDAKGSNEPSPRQLVIHFHMWKRYRWVCVWLCASFTTFINIY